MTGRFVALASVGWLCLACSLAAFGCVSAQNKYSQPTEVTPISVDRSAVSSEDDVIANCRADIHCTLIETDGSGSDPPPLFLRAVTNEAITKIVLTADRYMLKVSYWEQFKDNPYVLRRNLTVLSAVTPYGLLDFDHMERRVLVASGVTVLFKSIVLKNIRKLGGWAIDFFVGGTGSQVILQDVVHVKPACQLPSTTLKSAASFQRVSAAYPPNNLTIWDSYCVDAAINGPTVTHNCYENVLHFLAFSNVAASDDPNLGRQYPGYILFQDNTTRVCQATITQQCLDQNNGDEELCLVMLITATMNQGGNSFTWTQGTIAGVAIAAAAALIGVTLLIFYRNHILLWCLNLSGKSLQDIESGGASSKEWVMQHALPLALGHVDGIADDGFNGSSALSSGQAGRRAISQQVTLGVLLGAGSFGRVYRGRWHSTDVAVKIMSCSPDELPKVLKEAEVMMQLNHENVVRAFHASVWNPQEQARALKARESRVSGSNIPSPDGTRTTKQGPSRNHSTALGINNSSGQHVQSSGQHVHYSGSAASPDTTAAGDNTSSSSHAAARQQDGPALLTVVPHLPDHTGSSRHSNSPLARQAVTSANGASTAANDAAQQWYGDHPGMRPTGIPQQPSSPLDHYVNGSLAVAGASSSQDSSQPLRGPSTGSNAAAAHPPGPGSGLSLLNSNSGSGAGAPGGVNGDDAQTGLGNRGPVGPSAVGEAIELPDDQPHLLQQQHRQQGPAVSPFAGQQQQQGQEPEQLHDQHYPALHPGDRRSPQQAASISSGGDRSSAALASPKANGIMPTSPAAARAPAGTISASGTISAATSGVDGSIHANGMPGMAILSQTPDGYQGSSSGSARRKSKSKRSDSNRQDKQSVQRGGEPGQEIRRAEVQVWIVLELCTGGTLKDAVTSGKLGLRNRIETGQLLSRLLDTAKGMAYLHAKGIMHGDLKAGNVLLQNLHGGGDQVAKISDFGLAAVLVDGATHRSTASMGTITHMAPEVLRSGHVSCAADVYSFAIMMWEVLANKQVYHGIHYGAVVERVVVQGERPPIPDNVPEGLSILMQICWDAVPENRPTFEQIVTCLEIMLYNLSDIDSSNASVESALADGDSSPPAVYRSSSGIAAAAVANHLQQAQQAAVQPLAVPRALTPVSTASPFGGSPFLVSPASTLQQQPVTPQHGQPRPVMNGISRGPHDSSTQHSTHSESRSSRPVSQGHAVGPNMQFALDASPFLQDL